MFKLLRNYFQKRRYKITVTEQVNQVSVTYVMEADTVADLVECSKFIKYAIKGIEEGTPS